MYVHDDKKEGLDIGCVFFLRLRLRLLLFTRLFMTFCDTSFTNAIIGNTVIILATIITLFSSI